MSTSMSTNTKGRLKLKTRRQHHFDNILTALQTRQQLSNKEIRELIKKPRVTVWRYMSILKKQGRIQQVGKTGKYTYYKLKK